MNSKAYNKKNTFLKLGGHPILDLCNTKISHATRTEDRLTSLKDLSQFLFEALGRNFDLIDGDLEKIQNFRRAFHDFFSSIISSRSVENSLIEINRQILAIDFHYAVRYSPKNQTPFKVETLAMSHISEATQGIVTSFLAFLATLNRTRLKKCGNPNCSHLFYDSSKNQSRSWCSMKTCGNILKARNFYNKYKLKQKDSLVPLKGSKLK